MRKEDLNAALRGIVAAAAVAASLFWPAHAADAVDPAETQALHRLFDERWEELMRTHPEWATFSGDNRYGDRLQDASPAAIAAEFDAARRALARAKAIRRERLSASDGVSLDIFIHGEQETLLFEPFVGRRSMTLGPNFGFQSDFAGLLLASPVAQRAQAEQVLARMAAYPRRVDQELARLREGMALHWVPPRTVLDRVLAQIDGQLVTDIDKSPFFEPFTRLGKDIATADQDALKAQARKAIAEQVQPALRRLRDFVAGEYLAAAPPDGAMLHYPGGNEVYAALVRMHTTTDLSPAQIHAIGQRELSLAQGQRLVAFLFVVADGVGPPFPTITGLFCPIIVRLLSITIFSL